MSAAPTPRLLSLDAYRGLVMLALASGGLGLHEVAANFPGSSFWRTVGDQFEHVEWVGCSAWDLIQPSFMFLVGVSLAYSAAGRWAKGQTYAQMLRHALVRGGVLVLLGIFLRSHDSPHTRFTFEDVLTQIGLGYVFLFLLWGRRASVQLGAAAAILLGYWCLFRFWPLPPADFDFAAVGVPDSWPFLTGTAARWEKNANPAAYFDQWFLNLFPPRGWFTYNRGGYQTLNFVPSLATMIFGLVCGELLRGDETPRRKIGWLLAGAVLGLAAGLALDRLGFCPLVKRIWTPGWTLLSTGWTCLVLAVFYGVVDVLLWRRWTFPLVVLGMNSIAVYVIVELLPGWIQQTLAVHFGSGIYGLLGPAWEPLLRHAWQLLAIWLFAYWLYRQRVFLRI